MNQIRIRIRILSHTLSYRTVPKLAQKWGDVQALELPEADRAVLRGRRPEEASLLLLLRNAVERGCVSASKFRFCPNDLSVAGMVPYHPGEAVYASPLGDRPTR